MYLLDTTLDTPAENLALDEALLEWAAAQPADADSEVLRLWEPATHFVVVGRSSRVAQEVNLPECQARKLAVVRRASGGAAIVAGPGCLMYAVVLDCRRLAELRAIDRAHLLVLQRMADALQNVAPGLRPAGISDLVFSVPDAPDRKFSGNSLRIKRDHLLYHGTILYDFDLPMIGDCLQMPPRRPDYRRARPHQDFVANLALGAGQLRDLLATAWDAHTPLDAWPRELTAELAGSRYEKDDWNRRL